MKLVRGQLSGEKVDDNDDDMMVMMMKIKIVVVSTRSSTAPGRLQTR